MANLGKVSVGDKRTDLQVLLQVTDVSDVNAVENISGYATYDIILIDPDGNEQTLAGTFLNSGSDGISRHIITDATIIDESGIWSYKGYYVDASGGIYTSNPIFFEVLD